MRDANDELEDIRNAVEDINRKLDSISDNSRGNSISGYLLLIVLLLGYIAYKLH